MPLISSTKLLRKAREGKFAIPAFNIHNLETLRAVVEAACEENSPVILQTTPGTCQYAGIDNLVAMVRATAKKVPIPVVLHLDHASSKEIIFECIDAGYTSVMVDGSSLPFEENIALTKEVINYAKEHEVQVEAELGIVGGVEEEREVEDNKAAFTDPRKSLEFVQRTGVNSLAVAIGTVHGAYKGVLKLDYSRLEEIAKLVEIPLVLHGSSGVPDNMLKKVAERGICKINISTELKEAFVTELKAYFKENPEEQDPRRYFKPAMENVKALVKGKIKTVGSKDTF